MCEPPGTPLAAPAPDYNPLMTDGRHWTMLTMLTTFLWPGAHCLSSPGLDSNKGSLSR